MMQPLKIAATSVRNRIGQPEESIADMQVWTARAAGQGAELILFPELNVCGHIPTPIARHFAERDTRTLHREDHPHG